jgi:hypothetical protein
MSYTNTFSKVFMKNTTIQHCVKILFKDWNNNKTQTRYHYAFAILKNKIIAVGKNQTVYPSTKILELGKICKVEKWLKFPYPHAESDLITKLPNGIKLKNIEILSLRINRHGQFRLAKPCRHCQTMLDALNITKVAWSCNHSEYWGSELIIQKQRKIHMEMETLHINNVCTTLDNTWNIGINNSMKLI